MKTLREILLDAGIKENEIDNHCSDLYVKVTEISKQVINNYEYNKSITTFIDEIEHKLWYNIPFAYPEYYFLEKEKLTIPYTFKKELLKYFSLENSKRIITTLENQIGNREKNILNNYTKITWEEVILIVYDNKGNTFGIDTRTEENTFGNIVE